MKQKKILLPNHHSYEIYGEFYSLSWKTDISYSAWFDCMCGWAGFTETFSKDIIFSVSWSLPCYITEKEL